MEDDRGHGYSGPALGIYEGVQSEGELHEDRTEQIHREIVAGIAYRCIRSAYGVEYRFHEDVDRQGTEDCEYYEQDHPVAEIPAG